MLHPNAAPERPRSFATRAICMLRRFRAHSPFSAKRHYSIITHRRMQSEKTLTYFLTAERPDHAALSLSGGQKTFTPLPRIRETAVPFTQTAVPFRQTAVPFAPNGSPVSGNGSTICPKRQSRFEKRQSHSAVSQQKRTLPWLAEDSGLHKTWWLLSAPASSRPVLLHRATSAMKASSLCTAEICRHYMLVLPPNMT